MPATNFRVRPDHISSPLREMRAAQRAALLAAAVIPPFLTVFKSRGYAESASFCFGVIPPRAMFGRSWL